jgi:hypothetical protein
MQSTHTYRLYKLGHDGHIRAGTWIEAEEDDHARQIARLMCDEQTPALEIWQGERLIGRVARGGDWTG